MINNFWSLAQKMAAFFCSWWEFQVALAGGFCVRMERVSFVFDDGVEAALGVCGVVDGADSAIGFDDGVVAFDDVTFFFLPLVFDVAGVDVFDAVAVAVIGVCL